MTMVSNCSVVIPTMNRPNSLKRTIDKMLSSSVCPAEVIIVDQSREKEIREQNMSLAMKNGKNGVLCKYLYQEKPSSTKARNMGMQQATKEILVFADDDVDVSETTFAELEKLFQNPQIAMVAGLDSNMSLGSGNPIGYLFGMKSLRKRKI